MTRTICLALPTDRACAATIAALHGEAGYAAERFDVAVRLLVLDSAGPAERAAHAAAVAALPAAPGVTTHHLDEAAQRRLLRRAVDACPGRDDDPAERERLLELMLPAGVSYGACTNRAFWLATALGCESVHRRDSDSRYQVWRGEPVYPVRQELAALGLPVGRARSAADLDRLGGAGRADEDRTVVLAGASFVGAMSVDIAEMERIDPQVYAEVVGLWAPREWSDEARGALVAESFRGAGDAAFTGDTSTLCVVDPMRVDMCNIALHRDVYQRLPLPPALDTIGSDYVTLHAVRHAGLPGLLHNRHIVNFHTEQRRTDAGFAAYQLRFVRFLLSMRHLNVLYRRFAQAGPELLDAGGRLRADAIAELVHDSAVADPAENVWRLDVIDHCYRKLGGRYAEFAETLRPRGGELIERARRDMADFGWLVERWAPLVEAARTLPPIAPAEGHGS